ncbi:Long-chain fatty acid transport protein [Palleronia salina]|uniref:Long-chain fatty acid transport protein n=1 Tax=Palleronia salina TaxID=313368 RepID=A0A1M6B079_9RHOB|nr:outer membrane beta-barrel protein [Palleronia salina]SHI42122.1 Long-chain fatty acid transport protein [Palleronia salina]
MKKLFGTVAVLALAPAMAGALGLDRSGQPVTLLFEDGNYAELSFGRVFPSVDGNDVAAFGGSATGEVANNFSQVGLGVKYDLNDQLSFSLNFDQPYGSNVNYPTSSVALGGTRAVVDSRSIQALARYKLNNGFSVHGGLRYQEIQADVTLGGAAYGPLNGYRAQFDSDGDLGYVLGAAYERPEIALRVALTYFSGTSHDLPTSETLNGVGVGALPAAALGLPINPFSTTSVTKVDTPEALNLDFQTGIMEDTLLFGSVRYAWYEDTIVSPTFFDTIQDGVVDGDSLTDIDDGYALNIGVGRRFTDKLSGSIAFGYERSGDDLVSPLAPTNGVKSIALGLSYDVTEQFNLSGGVRYAKLGDAMPETGTPDTARANFTDNDVFAVGFSVGYSF